MTSILFTFCFLFLFCFGYLKTEQQSIDKKTSLVQKKIKKLWNDRGWKKQESSLKAIIQSADEAFKNRKYPKDAWEKFNKYSTILEYSHMWDVICKMMINAKFPDALAKKLMKLSSVMKKETNEKEERGVYLDIIHELLILAAEKIRVARLTWAFPKSFESVLMNWISIESDFETEGEFLAWVEDYTKFIKHLQKDVDFKDFADCSHELESRLKLPKIVTHQVQKLAGEILVDAEDPTASVTIWIDTYCELVHSFKNQKQFKDAEKLIYKTLAMMDEVPPCASKELNQIIGNVDFTKTTMNKRIYQLLEARFLVFQNYLKICQRSETRFSEVKKYKTNHVVEGDIMNNDRWSEVVDVALISSAILTENFTEENFQEAILDTTKSLTEELYEIYLKHSNCNLLDACVCRK